MISTIDFEVRSDVRFDIKVEVKVEVEVKVDVKVEVNGERDRDMSRDSNHDRDKNQNHKLGDLGSIQAAVFVEEKPNSLLGEVGSWNFAMREAFDLLEVIVSHVELLLREPLLVFDVNIVDGLEHLVLDSSSA